MNDKLLANVRFYFAQAVFNNSCHFKAYNRLTKKKKRVSNFIVSISAATLIVLLFQIKGLEQKNQELLNILAAIGMVLIGASLIFEMFNKEDVAFQVFQHKNFGEKYKALRDEYMSLIEEIMSDLSSYEQLKSKSDYLQKRYSLVGENAPETTGDDYKQAQKGLGLDGNSGEEFTWADAEIDKFLPEQLRLNKS